MSDVLLRRSGENNDERTIIEDPDYMNVLLNINRVAVDGNIYTDVTEVEFDD